MVQVYIVNTLIRSVVSYSTDLFVVVRYKYFAEKYLLNGSSYHQILQI